MATAKIVKVELSPAEATALLAAAEDGLAVRMALNGIQNPRLTEQAIAKLRAARPAS